MAAEKDVLRLQKKVSKWVSEWVVGATQRRLFFDAPHQVFADFIGGEDNSELVSLRAEKLSTWHLIQYTNLALNEGHFSPEEVALSAVYLKAFVELEEISANSGAGGTISLNQGALCYASQVIVGWQPDAIAVGAILLKGLDTSLLDLRLNPRHQAGELYRHFWFLMHLYCESVDIKLNTSLYSYPESMYPYDAVLSEWRTTDMNKVQTFVSVMADFHISEARTTKHDEIAEFDDEDRMLYPYEVLVFLRLREWAGLSNPKIFAHPLMQQPLATHLTELPLLRPMTPLLDQVVAKFKKDFLKT
jgi:hypothetical protein